MTKSKKNCTNITGHPDVGIHPRGRLIQQNETGITWQFPPRQCSSCLGKWSLSVTCWEGSLQYARVLTAWSVQKNQIIKHPCLEIIGRTDTQLKDATQTGTQDTIVSTFNFQSPWFWQYPQNKAPGQQMPAPHKELSSQALIGRLTQELQNQRRRSIKNCMLLSPSPRRELPGWSTCRVAGFTPLKDSKSNTSCTLHKLHERNPGLPRTLTIPQLVASPVLASLVGLP